VSDRIDTRPLFSRTPKPRSAAKPEHEPPPSPSGPLAATTSPARGFRLAESAVLQTLRSLGQGLIVAMRHPSSRELLLPDPGDRPPATRGARPGPRTRSYAPSRS
jgi:hypothetical protein